MVGVIYFIQAMNNGDTMRVDPHNNGWAIVDDCFVIGEVSVRKGYLRRDRRPRKLASSYWTGESWTHNSELAKVFATKQEALIAIKQVLSPYDSPRLGD